MNLFYQPDISLYKLDEEESRHAIRVLRMNAGDLIDITDGKGFFYVAKITEADIKKCSFEIVERSEVAKKKFKTHIAIAPTKSIDRIEWVVEKAVEIGIDEISFLLCKNSERKVINKERIEKIAVSAMKQSQQAWLPKINDMIPFKEIASMNAEQRFIAHVDASNQTHLRAVTNPEKNYLVLIGPEGDFSKYELEYALQNGFEKVSLGVNRLRTETAALVSCQILNLVNL